MCSGNGEIELGGVGDGSYLQFALQTVRNYNI